MKSELKQNEIKSINGAVLDKLVERGRTLAVLFYDPEEEDDRKALQILEEIDDECSAFEISFCKLNDEGKAATYGIDETPGLLYFESKIPSVYEGDLSKGDLIDKEALLDWLIEQKTTDTIEVVTGEILTALSEEEDYLLVLFTGPCDDDDAEGVADGEELFDEPCRAAIKTMEGIDGRVQKMGIMLVTTEEREAARQREVRDLPALGLFRNGDFLPYEGDLLEDALSVLEWLSLADTLRLSDAIEEVNVQMLDYLLNVETDIVAFFYREGNLQDEAILDGLEHIDDDLDERGLQFVKCSDKGAEKHFGLGTNPAVVHFEVHKHHEVRDQWRFPLLPIERRSLRLRGRRGGGGARSLVGCG